MAKWLPQPVPLWKFFLLWSLERWVEEQRNHGSCRSITQHMTGALSQSQQGTSFKAVDPGTVLLSSLKSSQVIHFQTLATNATPWNPITSILERKMAECFSICKMVGVLLSAHVVQHAGEALEPQALARKSEALLHLSTIFKFLGPIIKIIAVPILVDGLILHSIKMQKRHHLSLRSRITAGHIWSWTCRKFAWLLLAHVAQRAGESLESQGSQLLGFIFRSLGGIGHLGLIIATLSTWAVEAKSYWIQSHGSNEPCKWTKVKRAARNLLKEAKKMKTRYRDQKEWLACLDQLTALGAVGMDVGHYGRHNGQSEDWFLLPQAEYLYYKTISAVCANQDCLASTAKGSFQKDVGWSSTHNGEEMDLIADSMRCNQLLGDLWVPLVAATREMSFEKVCHGQRHFHCCR